MDKDLENLSNKEKVQMIQKIIYPIMCDIDDFCKKNNIRYFLSGGTCLGAVRHQVMMNRAYKIMKSSPKTGYVSSLYGDEANVRYPEKWFFPVRWVPFENIKLPIEADAEEYLKLTYGDYMQLPPLEKRVFHHGYTCVDFQKPYTDYKGTEYCKER